MNEGADLSPDMALRIEKAFGVSMDTLMRMQSNFDVADPAASEGEIAGHPLVPRQGFGRSPETGLSMEVLDKGRPRQRDAGRLAPGKRGQQHVADCA